MASLVANGRFGAIVEEVLIAVISELLVVSLCALSVWSGSGR